MRWESPAALPSSRALSGNRWVCKLNAMKHARCAGLVSAGVVLLALCVTPLLTAQTHQDKPRKAENVPTGMRITPTAAPGSSLQFLNPDLPGMPEYLADHPIATALSPDGNALLVLTSGYNQVSDIRA